MEPVNTAAGNITAGLNDRGPAAAGVAAAATETAKATAAAGPGAEKGSTEKGAAEGKGQADGGAQGDEMAAMKKRLEELEAKDKQTTDRRAAEDFKSDFIREHQAAQGFPREMLNKFLPTTNNEKELINGMLQLGKWFDTIIASEVQRGRLVRTSVNVGGASRDGGVPVWRLTAGKTPDTPYDNLGHGLRNAQRQVITQLTEGRTG